MGFSFLEYDVEFNYVEKKVRILEFRLWKAKYSCSFGEVWAYKVQS